MDGLIQNHELNSLALTRSAELLDVSEQAPVAQQVCESSELALFGLLDWIELAGVAKPFRDSVDRLRRVSGQRTSSLSDWLSSAQVRF
jgi:hypothetical protein